MNAPDFIGIDFYLDGEKVDLNKVTLKDFRRVLDMKHGILKRSFTIVDSQNRETRMDVTRFLSIVTSEIAAISYSITPLSHEAKITFVPYLNGNVYNEDSNYDEKFWLEVEKKVEHHQGYLTMKTRKLDFHVTFAMKYEILLEGEPVDGSIELLESDSFVGNEFSFTAIPEKSYTLYKYISVVNSRYYEVDRLANAAMDIVKYGYDKGFENLLYEHSMAWENRWIHSDISIEGDLASQQGIRFSIFQLHQTYTGVDPRLNIGPKGFTGERYGGGTYWDTEAFCLPFYLATHDERVGRNLLIYRYNQLDNARKNASKIGLKGALYPMTTMNGEECHSEWEITFEEIHRNAAISYAIFNYVTYTGDDQYLFDYGLEVLVEISRFWASRVSYNTTMDKYMILGVTGPNEYENNVNNNWYTNIMASWNLDYALEAASIIRQKDIARYNELASKLNLSDDEMKRWKDISLKMYYPYVESLGIFEQQDGYMNKELLSVNDVPTEELPLNQHWSWDKILRSCFIKQADVIQGLYFLNHKFDLPTKRRNLEFYEPKTVHESSLSPSVYSIIASEIGCLDKAYELYLKTARMDLDNRNNDTQDGLHITGMAGAWMSIVHGFAGMRIKEGILSFNPSIPENWNSYSFKILFRGRLLKTTVNKESIIIEQEIGESLTAKIFDNNYTLTHNGSITVKSLNNAKPG